MHVKPFHVNQGGAFKLYNGPNKVYQHELVGQGRVNPAWPKAGESYSSTRAHYGELVTNTSRTRVAKAISMATMAKPLTPVEGQE